MRKTALLALLGIILFTLCIGGCQPQIPNPETNTTEEPDVTVEEPTVVTGELIEKRGQNTNITEFDALVNRFSKVQSYKYTITDSAYGSESHQFYVKGRFVRRVLNNQEYHPSGEIYDEVLMDRVTKQAFTHCGADLCTKPNPDKEVEPVNYEDYYLPDPYEHITTIIDARYIGDKMVGDQYTKVFIGTHKGAPTRIWVQEYYGFPVRIEIGDGEEKRVIKFEDMMVDATRNAEVDMPFNFTVKGTGKYYWNWESLLGLKQPHPQLQGEQQIVPFSA